MICISGANSQIGSYLAESYAASGYPLFLLYHNKSNRIEHLSQPMHRVDLRDYAAVELAVKSCSKPIDVLIHCAAVRSHDSKALYETDPLLYRNIFDSNFYPAYHVLRAILPSMTGQRFGRVVLFASDITRSGLANGSAYSAAKAAIANLAKSSSLESIKHNVLINCVSPGPVDTDLEEDFEGAYLEFRKQYFASHINNSAANALISKEEIKAVVDLLIDPRLRNICGEEIFLTGGKA
jgi:NAD(P)-dependent dehydrogenase (short-subunit alcohol dehydrogenase family)